VWLDPQPSPEGSRGGGGPDERRPDLRFHRGCGRHGENRDRDTLRLGGLGGVSDSSGRSPDPQ
jgi:hypothetical protein